MAALYYWIRRALLLSVLALAVLQFFLPRDGGDRCSHEEVRAMRDRYALAMSAYPGLEVMAPALSVCDQVLLDRMLRNASSYQEFGAGGSTVLAVATPGIRHIHAVESSREWSEKLTSRADILSAVSKGRLQLVHVDIGPTGSLGYPKDQTSKHSWRSYSEEAAKSELIFDVMFFDGPFRVACFLKALKRIRPEHRGRTALILHDDSDEVGTYSAVELFADIVIAGDAVAVFRKKPVVDESLLSATIQDFEQLVDRPLDLQNRLAGEP